MPNQYKPLHKSSFLIYIFFFSVCQCSHLAPLADIEHWIKVYFDLKLTDGKIVKNLKEHYDTDQYSVGCVHLYRLQIIHGIIYYLYTRVSSLKRLRKQLDLKSTRQQKHTTETIAEAIGQIRKLFPSRGNEMVRKELWQRFGIHASR